MISERGAIGGMVIGMKTKILGKKTVQVPFCPLQMQHGLIWH
jgi:hypothetical protein